MNNFGLNFVWDCIVLPCLQTQGTVTAVQLQTEAPVVTASGQQVQTLQVVVSLPQQCDSLPVCMLYQGCFYDPFVLSGPSSPLQHSLWFTWTACSSAVYCVPAPGLCLCSHGFKKTTLCLRCICCELFLALKTSVEGLTFTVGSMNRVVVGSVLNSMYPLILLAVTPYHIATNFLLSFENCNELISCHFSVWTAASTDLQLCIVFSLKYGQVHMLM